MKIQSDLYGNIELTKVFDIDKMYIIRQEIDKVFNKEAAREAWKKAGGKSKQSSPFNLKALWDDIYQAYPVLDTIIEQAQKEWYSKYQEQGGKESFDDAVNDSNLTKKRNKTDWLTADQKNEFWNLFQESNDLNDYKIDQKGQIVTYKEWLKDHRKEFMEYERPTEMGTTHGRNNIIFDTLWGSLTNSLSATQIFTPGNFDKPKKYGYMAAVLESVETVDLIEAAKKSENSNANALAASAEDMLKQEGAVVDRYTLANALSTSELKTLLSTSKNLVYNHIHLQFHKQNMVAGKLIGIFAQNNVSHSVIGLSERVELDPETNKPTEIYPTILLSEKDQIVLDGNLLSGSVAFDRMNNRYGSRISSELAAYLAASVDAVKDPVLNYMNVNEVTAGVLCTMVRLGYDTELAMMFLSRPIIKTLVQKYISENETNDVSIDDIAQDLLKENGNITIPTPMLNKDLLMRSINEDRIGQSKEDNCNYIQAFLRLYNIARSTSNIVTLTKFNSVTAAVGPLITDTISMKMKVSNAMMDPRLSSKEMQMAINNDIPRAFREATLGVATERWDPINNEKFYTFEGGLSSLLFDTQFITSSLNFMSAVKKLENVVKGSLGSEKNRPLLNRFSDFYIAFALNSAKGELGGRTQQLFQTETNPNPLSKERRSYLLRELPAKVNSLKSTSTNPLIKAIQIKGQDSAHTMQWMTINTRAFSSDQVDDLKAAWYELYLGTEEEKQIALDLIEYNYAIDCFGFSPVTFSKLIPIQLRNKIPYYTTNLSQSFTIDTDTLIDQFIRNNHNEKSLVYQIQDAVCVTSYSGGIYWINSNLAYIERQGKPKMFAKLPNGTLLRAVNYWGGGEPAPTTVKGKVKWKYETVQKLGGETGEIIEFNPNGRAETIFTEEEQASQRERAGLSSGSTAGSKVFDDSDQLIYFLYNKIPEDMRDVQIKSLKQAVSSNNQEQIKKAITDLFEAGHCGNVANFTNNMGGTTAALVKVLNFLNPSSMNEKKQTAIERIIAEIQSTQEQLKICK